nr:uncharacterized protein LOC103441147 [Malus domestica]
MVNWCLRASTSRYPPDCRKNPPCTASERTLSRTGSSSTRTIHTPSSPLMSRRSISTLICTGPTRFTWISGMWATRLTRTLFCCSTAMASMCSTEGLLSPTRSLGVFSTFTSLPGRHRWALSTSTRRSSADRPRCPTGLLVQNEEGIITELYILGKCSETNK